MNLGKKLRTLAIEPLREPVRELTRVRLVPARRPVPVRVQEEREDSAKRRA